MTTESPNVSQTQPTPAADPWQSIYDSIQEAIEPGDPTSRAEVIREALDAVVFHMAQEKAVDAAVEAELADGAGEEEALDRVFAEGRYDVISDAAGAAVGAPRLQNEMNALVHTVMAVLNHVSDQAVGGICTECLKAAG
jgi:Arc/MetJ-type ribon-helix-helix transcriptional regulator